VTEQIDPTFQTRIRGIHPLAAIGVLVGALLVVAAVAVATAAPSSASGADPAAAAALSSLPDPSAWSVPNAGAGPFGLFGRFGHGRAPGRLRDGVGNFRQITIASINGSTIGLRTDDGWTRTITIGSSTKLTRGSATIALSDLAVGDHIRFSETRNSDGSFTITALAVVLPQVNGTVKDVTDGDFTVMSSDGSTWTITVTAATTYSRGGAAGSKADVAAGDLVSVTGSQGQGNSLTATAVRIALPIVAGQVTAKTASTITIAQRDGTSATVHVGSGTTYRAPGAASASLANVTVGAAIVVQATKRPDGSYDAVTVLTGPGRGILRPFMIGPRGPNAMPGLPGASSAPPSTG
jgi:hypothetical protein